MEPMNIWRGYYKDKMLYIIYSNGSKNGGGLNVSK